MTWGVNRIQSAAHERRRDRHRSSAARRRDSAAVLGAARQGRRGPEGAQRLGFDGPIARARRRSCPPSASSPRATPSSAKKAACSAGSSERTWIIDPLDGTSNYLQHFPFWSISIALRERGETIAGLVYEPLRDLFFTAERGAGAFRNGARMRISSQETLEGAFIATGFPFRAQEYVAPYVAIFTDVIRTAKGVRRAGSAALDLAYTAASIFDGFFEMHLAPWDVAAGALLVTEAGGVVTDFSGGQRWLERGNIVGASAGVHRDLMTIMARHVTEDQLDHRKGPRIEV
jgi:myo-inositol-1(or 4)-monophosphatase